MFALKNNDSGLTFKMVDDYFVYLLKQEVFGKKLLDFPVWRKMGGHDDLFEVIKAVVRFHKVKDPLFVEWWTREKEGSWLPPTLFTGLDWTDVYFLDQAAEEIWEDPYEALVWVDHRDMWKTGMEETVLEYQLAIKRCFRSL